MKCLLLSAFALALAGLAFGQGNGCVNNPACIVYSFNGVLGPVQSGTDPLGLEGQTFLLTASISPTEKPVRTWKTSSDFGFGPDVWIFINGGNPLSNLGIWKLSVTVGSSYDKVGFSGNYTGGPYKGVIMGITGYIEAGSWPTGSLRHPMRFSPSPQNVIPPLSVLHYTPPDGAATVLGFTGITQVNIPPNGQ